MRVEVNDKYYEIIIVKKSSTKNIYIRVKEDLKIYVTANKYTSDRKIKEVIENNYQSIERMINKIEKRNAKKDDFYYLGKKYDIVYSNNSEPFLGDEKVFIKKDSDLKKWYKKRAIDIFQKELDKIYEIFPYEIPYPSLTIREMKTRHGVCNTKTKRITLNLDLIKKDLIYLDYVIVHELSHLVHANHSKDFWKVVEEVLPNYKLIRKGLKNNE